MSSRGSLRAIVVVVVLSGIAVAYLYQHWWSVQLTRAEVRLTEERRLLEEKVDSLDVELFKLQSFCRLESLRVSNGKQIAKFESKTADSVATRVVKGEAVAVAGMRANSER